MRYKLLVDIKGYWKQLGAGYDYDKLLKEAMTLNAEVEWMIVEVKRYCSGSEREEIGNDDVGSL